MVIILLEIIVLKLARGVRTATVVQPTSGVAYVPNVTLSSGNYSISVGNGGVGVEAAGACSGLGANGSNSRFLRSGVIEVRGNGGGSGIGNIRAGDGGKGVVIIRYTND